MPNNNGGPGREAPDPSVDPSPISTLHVKSLADLAHMAEQLPVNWEALPRVPFFGSFMGYTDQWYRAAVGMGVLETRWRGQRELTPDEVQVVARGTAKAVVTMSWELPALVATTYYLERRGRATFRFPFYQPTSPPFSPDSFPMQGRYALLQGPAARATWHMLRASLYGSLSHWGLRILFTSYALSVKGAEFERDPRLADLRASIKQAMAARMSARRRGQEPAQQLSPLPPPQGRSPPQPSQDGGAGAYAGDADPTAFQQAEERQHQNPYAPAAPPTQRRPWSQPQTTTAATATAAEPETTAYDVDGFDDEGYHDEDDASPVAASAARRKRWQRATAASQEFGSSSTDDGSGGGGSAWDRVRDQAAHGTMPPARHWAAGWRRGGETPQKPTAAPAADRDYVFDAATEEKALAREQAQREFDAMMEKERRGESDTRPTRR